MDDKYYVHPKVRGVGRTEIKGCCSFDVGGAEVSKLTGDVDGRLVRGAGYQMEVAFGHRIAALDGAFIASGHRSIDGVSIATFQAGPRRQALQATVPLSREAAQRRIDFPQLQVVGSCDTDTGCERLRAALGTIRF